MDERAYDEHPPDRSHGQPARLDPLAVPALKEGRTVLFVEIDVHLDRGEAADQARGEFVRGDLFSKGAGAHGFRMKRGLWNSGYGSVSFCRSPADSEPPFDDSFENFTAAVLVLPLQKAPPVGQVVRRGDRGAVRDAAAGGDQGPDLLDEPKEIIPAPF